MGNGNGSPVPTAAEAVAASPLAPITNREAIREAQYRMRDLGYVDFGEPDGVVGLLMKDEILAFRHRNNLPLVPQIDSEFMKALAIAQPKALPTRQVEASEEHVAERVEVVNTTAQVANVSAWGKIMAYLTGAPAGVGTLIYAAVDNFDEATAALQPVKTMFDQIPTKYYLVGFVVIAAIFGYQAIRAQRLAQQAKEQIVEGYREGTVKNDVGVPNGKLS